MSNELTPEGMTNTLWWPEALVDEIMPEGRKSPDDWIVDHNGAPALSMGEEEDNDGPPQPLQAGQIIQFSAMVELDMCVLRLDAQGGYTVERPMHPEATDCCILHGWQFETMAESVDGCVQGLRDGAAEPGDYVISYYTWKHQQAYQFDAAKRCFVKIGRA